MSWLDRTELCAECKDGPADKRTITIAKCVNCGRVACDHILFYAGTRGYACKNEEKCRDYEEDNDYHDIYGYKGDSW